MPLPPDCRPWTLAGLLVCLACSGGTDLLLPGDGEPAHIELEEGGPQSGRVGEPLTDSLVFSVTDSRARPVEGARITFDLGSAGPGADVVPDTATTDANGMAGVMLVLGTRVGSQVFEARVLVGEEEEEPKTSVTIMALPENANGISAVSGDDQTAPAGSTLSQPLVVQVTDAFGNPISGVPITWTAPDGGSVSETSNVTDGDGRASVVRTLGPTAGTQTTLAASEEPLAGSPVTFTHTATAGSVAGLSIVSGNEQTAAAGTELPGDLVVRLVDAGGNGVPGAAVTWVVGLGGGTVAPENSTTDEAGRTFTRWTLGPSPGENRVDAVVSGVGIANFRATGTASAPARLAMVTQPSGSARNGVPLERQPVVQLRDTQGNPANTPGVVITAQLSGGGGELLGTRQRATGPNGSAAFTDLAIAGAEGNRALVFTASGYAGVTSSAIQVRPVPTTTTITSDSPDPSVAGATVTVGFRVSSEALTPAGSVTVTALDGGANCTGSLQGGAGSCQMVLNRTGQRMLRASYSGAPGFMRSSGTEGHVVGETPPPTSAPTTTTIISDSPDPSIQGTQFTVEFQVSSGAGTPTGNVTVTVSDGTPTCTGSLQDGRGSCQMTLNGVGDRTLTATYSGAPGLDRSSDTEPHRVDPAPPVNRPPDADYNWDCEGNFCKFTDASTDPEGNGTIASWSWNFGDGSQGSSDRNPDHTFPGPGTYQVTLTVTDNGGLSNQSTAGVTVDPQGLEVTTQPSSSATVGVPFDRQPEIQLRSDGEDIDRAGVVVSAAIASGSGTLGGTTTATTDENGRARFSDLRIDGATDPHTLSFSADGFGSVTSSTIEVQKLESDIDITSIDPEGSTPGEPVEVHFEITGRNGLTPTGTVIVIGQNGAGETVAGPCPATLLSDGTGSCTISFAAEGDYSIVAAYSGDDRFEGDTDQEDHDVMVTGSDGDGGDD